MRKLIKQGIGKVLVVLVLAVLVVTSFTANAATTAVVSATVTVTNISVTLDTDGAVAYGTIGQNSTKDTTTGGEGVNDTESVQNTGNVNENFTIEGASTAAWTLTTAAVGSDTYNHSWCTATCDTTPTWNPFNATPEALASAIAPAASQTFDLRINSPNPSTVFTQQTAGVTITASAS